MALLIVQGSTSYALSQQDLQRYPGSTLSSMVTSVSPQDGPVKLQADELQGSPLGDWPEAASITAALYRRDHKALLTSLSKVLASSSTDAVYKQIKALVDYLGLPEPLNKLLPPCSTLTLQHLPVLDLHYLAMTNQAVELMLSSPLAFQSYNGVNTWPANAAYFYLRAQKDGACPVGVDVYAVGGGTLADPSNNPAAWTPDAEGRYSISIGYDVSAMKLSGLHSTPLGTSALASSTSLQAVCTANAGYNSDISPVDQCFGHYIEAALKAAISGIALSSLSGRTAQRVQLKCVSASYSGPYGSPRSANLWVIHR